MLSLDDLWKRARAETPLIKFRAFSRGEILPAGIRMTCRADQELEKDDEIFAMGFHASREWLYSAIENTQPQVYAALMQASDLHLLLSQSISAPDRWGNPSWFIESQVRLIRLDLQRSVPLCARIREGVTSHGHYRKALPSLGHDLSSAYCSLVGGMSIASDIPGALGSNLLPGGMIDWAQAYICILTGKHGVSDWLNLSDSEAARIVHAELEALWSNFDYLREEDISSGGLTKGLRCFIDTRSEGANEGRCDFILVQTPADKSRIRLDEAGEPIIYRVKDHDWENIEIVKKPSLAIDTYVSSVLLNNEVRFDFDRFCS